MAPNVTDQVPWESDSETGICLRKVSWEMFSISMSERVCRKHVWAQGEGGLQCRHTGSFSPSRREFWS